MPTLLIDIETAPSDWRQVAEDPAHRPPLYVAEEAVQRVLQARPTAKGISTAQAAAWTAWRRRALDSKLGATVSISVRPSGGGVVSLGPTNRVIPEAQLLGLLLATLDRVRPTRIVAHGGDGFDFPWLAERALLLGIPGLARWFAGAVPYRVRQQLRISPPAELVDTLDLWPSPGWGARDRAAGNGLRAIADALGVDWSADPLADGGGDVLDALLDNRPEDVHAHCRTDVEILAAVWERAQCLLPTTSPPVRGVW